MKTQFHQQRLSFPPSSHFRPIFIVNTVTDSETETDAKSGYPNTTSEANLHVNMEINNNNSLYLLKNEDKRDKNDNRMQCENKISQIVTACGVAREKIVESSTKEVTVIKAIKMEQNEQNVTKTDSDESSPDISKSSNEIVTQTNDKIPIGNESGGKMINHKEVIRNDSERLGEKVMVNVKAVMSGEVQTGATSNETEKRMTRAEGESEKRFFVIGS
jgi:hypothetical protein